MQHDKCDCFHNEIVLIIFIRTNYFQGLLETIRIALKFYFEFLSSIICVCSMISVIVSAMRSF